jgi:hypothetical protein
MWLYKKQIIIFKSSHINFGKNNPRIEIKIIKKEKRLVYWHYSHDKLCLTFIITTTSSTITS